MRTYRASFLFAIFMSVSIILIDSLVSIRWTSENGFVSAKENHDYEGEHDKSFQMGILLERIYLDGEISEETMTETIWSAEEFWAKYDEWQVIEMNDEKIVFRQMMDDISPLLKTNGYFGITEDGVLTIFNGKPEQTNIIQSFFQIDIKKLESTKREELRKGIPIKTKDRYVEVLEAFKSYSNNEKLAK